MRDRTPQERHAKRLLTALLRSEPEKFAARYAPQLTDRGHEAACALLVLLAKTIQAGDDSVAGLLAALVGYSANEHGGHAPPTPVEPTPKPDTRPEVAGRSRSPAPPRETPALERDEHTTTTQQSAAPGPAMPFREARPGEPPPPIMLLPAHPERGDTVAGGFGELSALMATELAKHRTERPAPPSSEC